MKKVCFTTIGDVKTASSRIRVYQNLNALKKIGWDCRVNENPVDSDVAVFQKTYSENALNLALKCKGKIVFDLSDAEWCHGQWVEDRILHMAKVANVIVTSSIEQAKWFKGKGFNAHVIPCGFDFDSAPKVDKHSNLTFCWTGSSTNERFLQILVNPLNKLREKYLFDLKLICDLKSMHFPKFNFNPQLIQWNMHTNLLEVAKCHIGLSPLLKKEHWCFCKPSTKIIIYMAMDLAVVCTTIPSYTEVIKDSKNGFLAWNETDWYNSLEILMQDKEKRLSIIKEGKKTALEFSVDKIAKKWSDLFNES